MIRFQAHLLIVSSLLAAVACESASVAASYSQKGTCASTCEKSVALTCTGGPSSVPTCTSECEAQIAKCNDPAIVATYLDCVQSTTMNCGEFTAKASSPDCVAPGLTYAACIAGITPGKDVVEGDGIETDASAGDDTVASGPLVAPTVVAGEVAVIVRDGTVDTEIRCATATAEGPLARGNRDDGGVYFRMSCFTGTNPAQTHHGLTVEWWQQNGLVGSYPITQVKDFTLHLVTADTGFSTIVTGALPAGMTMTVHFEADAFPGGTMKGRFEAAWTDAIVWGGKGTSPVSGPRPGQLAAAFDLPIP